MSAPARIRGDRFRELVVLGLRAEGVAAESRPPANRLSEIANPDRPQSHISGIDGWSFVTSNEVRLDPGRALARAESAADLDENPHGAAVLRRAGKSVESQYVVLTLASFAALIRGQR